MIFNLLIKDVSRKISRGGTIKKKTENSTIKPLSTISVPFMKIQGGALPLLLILDIMH